MPQSFDNVSGPTALAKTPLKILVLMGGPSNEREVSLMSGTAVADALDSLGHCVDRGDINPQDISVLDSASVDVVFIAMHGEFGEDGQVQRLCEQRGLPYVGSPPDACKMAMDKAAAKSLFSRNGINTPDWCVVEEYDNPATVSDMDALGLPCVIKPITGGSSLDVFIVADATTRHERLQYMLDKYSRCMVERYIPGREFTAAVLGERVLPVLEIVPDAGSEFYDYDSKYTDDNTVFLFDHGLSDDQVESMTHDTITAHRLLGCRDISRADFRLDDNGVAWLLEVNVIPGMTGHSLVPKAADAVGIDFPSMCQQLISAAVDRGPDRVV